MDALAIGTDSVVRVKYVPKPVLKEGQALVRITAAALNRRDYWITQGLYPKIKLPSILGSDGCGVVELTSKGFESWIGKTVVINPGYGWGPNEEVADPDYTILGMPLDGTFAEYIAIDVDRLHEKPAHLSNIEAAAFPLAGITGYRALFVKGGAKPDHKVLVTGIGSGVAQLVAQMAVLHGCQVWITTSSDERIEAVKQKLGVHGGFNYKTKNWAATAKKTAGEFDIVIDGTAGKDFGATLNLLKPGGKLVNYGATAGAISGFSIHSVFLLHKQIIGTSMGSDKDFSALVQFISKHKMVPSIDSVRPYREFQGAFDRMKVGEQLGKIVLTFGGSSKL